VIIRHAEAVVTASAPPSSWHLSPSGTASAERLGHQLAEVLRPSPTIHCSSERKAIQTAAAVSSTATTIDPRFGEVQKPWYEVPEEHDAAALRYPDGEDPTAITDLGTGLAGCVTHGTVMALWLSHRLNDFDPCDFWQGLTFPDAHLVTSVDDAYSVERIAVA